MNKTKLDKILFGTDEHLIKKFYGYFLPIDLEFEQVKDTMIKWMRNIGYTIDIDKWQQIWERSYKMTMSTAYKENIYKMFYRWYRTPERLAKMFKNRSMKCWKCNHLPGCFYHMWWTFAEVKKFWKEIQHWIEKILKRTIEFKPELFLLGILPESLTKEEIYLIVIIVTAARIAYAQNWKLNKIPNEREILCKILDCTEMNRLTFKLKDEECDYYKIWGKYYEWLETKNN